MIDIKRFSKAKSTTNGNTSVSSSSTGFANTVIKEEVEGVTLWGQYHDHTANISGDLNDVGNINASGTIATDGNINATGTITASTVETTTLNSATINNEQTINTGALSAENVTSDVANVDQNLYVGEDITTPLIIADNGQIKNITAENLTVTKAAHFFQLIIDEVKATQGQIIVTPANAEIIDVVYSSSYQEYTLYFRANDADGNQITNNFVANDQILCQTFNAATGTSYNVSNKFYWCKCTRVSSRPQNRTIDGQSVPCHYIVVSWTDKDTNTNGVPESGDKIVMLGNRNDTTRQAAIVIGAYNNAYLDATLQAPFIAQYSGVNDYNLTSHRVNIISKGENTFKGKFSTTTGDDIETLIEEAQQGAMTYMHMAYSTSADGQTNFNKEYFTGAKYVGFCSNHTQSDAGLTYQNYTWALFKGEDAVTPTMYDIFCQHESIRVKDNVSTDGSFVVRGYVYSPNKTEVENYAQITFNHSDSSEDWSTFTNLMYLVRPQSMSSEFAKGLTSIQIDMYDNPDTVSPVVASAYIPVLRDGEDGTNGEDAFEYKLIPNNEIAAIDTNGTLGVNFNYNIILIKGQTYSHVTALTNSIIVRFRAHKTDGSTTEWQTMSVGTTTPNYVNANYESGWKDKTNKTEYFEIQLYKKYGTNVWTVVDSRIVYAQLAPSATFTITDNITSTVQGHTGQINSLNQNVATNTNSISTIQQDYNRITSTVNSHTVSIQDNTNNILANSTDISNLTENVEQNTDDISTLDGRVDGNTTDIANLTENVEQNTDDISTLDGRVDGNTTDINGLKNSVTTITNNVSSVQQQANSIQATVTTQQQTINNHTGQITANTNNIAALNITANNIDLKVDDLTDDIEATGIDIQNGTITLSAENTIFNGNINLNNPEDGFILRDNNDVPNVVILNDNIVNTGMDELLSNVFNGSAADNQKISHPFTFDIGKQISGTTLNINNPYFIIAGMEESLHHFAKLTVSLKKDGETTSETTENLTKNRERYNGQSVTLNITENGHYYLQMFVEISFVVPYTGSYTLECRAYKNNPQQQYTAIGTNGMVVKTNNEQRLLAKQDEIGMMFGADNVIKVKDGYSMRSSINYDQRHNMQAANNVIFGDISTTLPYRNISAAYTPNAFDGLIRIMYDGASITLPLSYEIPTGKMFYVWNNIQGTTINAATNVYIYYNGVNTSTFTMQAFRLYKVMKVDLGIYVITD